MQRLNQRLANFIEQRENVVLNVRCGQAEAPVVLRSIQGVDESNGSDFFWVFPENFSDPISYVETIVQSFVHARDELRGLQEKEGIDIAPEVPEALRSATARPVERLRQLMVFSRSLLPQTGEASAVWALFPLEVNDSNAWSRFHEELMQHEWPFPWCHHLRVYIRELPAIVLVPIPLPPRTDECLVDLGPQVIARGLVEDAEDERLPLQTRMNSVLMLGCVDQSHRRYEAARGKFDLVLRYAIAADLPSLACIAMNQMGETWKAQGDKLRAAGFCRGALVAGAAQPIPAGPPLLNASINAGELAVDAGQWSEAEYYFEAAALLAAVQSDPRTRLRCLNRRGLAQYNQSKVENGLASWNEVVKATAQSQFIDLRLEALELLKKHYQLVGNRVAYGEVAQMIARATTVWTPS